MINEVAEKAIKRAELTRDINKLGDQAKFERIMIEKGSNVVARTVHLKQIANEISNKNSALNKLK